jgi:hypothetical protein
VSKVQKCTRKVQKCTFDPWEPLILLGTFFNPSLFIYVQVLNIQNSLKNHPEKTKKRSIPPPPILFFLHQAKIMYKDKK